MTDAGAVLVWFRQDLRVRDNPALHAAVAAGVPVVPVFIWAPEEESPWAPGAASRCWLERSLRSLDRSLRARGSRLVLRRGASRDCLRDLVEHTKARAVFWNRLCEPQARVRDAAVEDSLRREGLQVRTFNAALLFEPREILNAMGNPYKVFTPFWNACLKAPAPPPPGRAPSRIPALSHWPASLEFEDLGMRPASHPWQEKILSSWQPGEDGAVRQLKSFLRKRHAAYARRRDRPDEAGTSRLSPHLHFQEIGPRQIWHALKVTRRRPRAASAALKAFARQLGWREFGYHLLYHFPDTSEKPLRPEFAKFPWARDEAALKAWQKGRTGYPIVDAGMRELWATGWMHNRVRMIVASFLIKDLLLPWQAGARWFWDTLVDADLANNTLGWQWTAGCGADAAPFFRIFNPVLQGEKFDPEGQYVRRWVPELSRLPARWIHKPWLAPPRALESAGAKLDGAYPSPIVDHGARRLRALAAYERIMKGRGTSR